MVMHCKECRNPLTPEQSRKKAKDDLRVEVERQSFKLREKAIIVWRKYYKGDGYPCLAPVKYDTPMVQMGTLLFITPMIMAYWLGKIFFIVAMAAGIPTLVYGLLLPYLNSRERKKFAEAKQEFSAQKPEMYALIFPRE